MSIKFTKGIEKDNISLLCKWSNERGAIFQEQWMGSKVSFPLTYEKIEKLENKFSVFYKVFNLKSVYDCHAGT